MAVNEHWQYQGRQQHQCFGHGTAPKDGKEQAPAKPGSLFDPMSVGQRIEYASGSVVAHSPRNQRPRWDARVGGTNQDSLKTAVAVWHGASRLSRDAFRQRLLDPTTSDETVDRLRSAATAIVNARTHAQLGAAGEDLAAAAHTIGPDRWSRFIGDAERRGVAAVSDGTIPGVMKASAASSDAVVGAAGLGLVLLMMALKNQGTGSARPTISRRLILMCRWKSRETRRPVRRLSRPRPLLERHRLTVLLNPAKLRWQKIGASISLVGTGGVVVGTGQVG